ncbi:phosphatidate cytidylyltransferase [Spiroplasma cantharicola]|uniref:Phosphatidate cytidylyltransferase n=1 Tax=Spiroplasma cantharicola TaxID=362837 RepID=A0A0M4JSR5_9MOLU|nr:phosphatidate cytidylyltransferase [Spiroplasma cantharicola]ALD66647.1 phosphatidate cytidylyltransferase [Spiroplasma cantharicola]
MKKNKDKNEFEITETAEISPEINGDIGNNRFKLPSAKRNFKVRVLSTIVLLALLLGFVVSGAIYTSLKSYTDLNADAASYTSIILTVGLLGICMFEMNKTMGFKNWYYQVLMITFATIMFIFPLSFNMYNFSFYTEMSLETWLQLWQFPVLVTSYLIVTIIIGFADKRIDIKSALINFIMTMIIIMGLKAFSISSLGLIETVNPETNEIKISARFSFVTIVWIWMMIILSDSFQYIGGMRFGKTKLSPNISPKKTWEGALIGLGVAATSGIIFAMIFKFTPPLQDFQPLKEPMQSLGGRSMALEIIVYILLALVFPIIGLFGDLLFSWVKRQVNIKDYSNLIPGHGGALDRMDSILFSLFVLFIFISSVA